MFNLTRKDFGPEELHFLGRNILRFVEEAGSPVVIGFAVFNLPFGELSGGLTYDRGDIPSALLLLETHSLLNHLAYR